MKHFFIAAFIVLSLTTLPGCAHREITQAPEQQTPPVMKSEEPKAEPQKRETPAPSSSKQEEIASQTITEKGTKAEDIHFDFDKSDIRQDAKPALKSLSELLASSPAAQVVIEGNCDERGTSEYNLALGDRRANSAKSYLVSLGIPSSRLKTISYGKEKPLCTESTEDCWAKNRRDHFVLTEGR